MRIPKLVNIVLLAMSCSAAIQERSDISKGEPPWLTNLYYDYPEEFYFVGIGTGNSRESAENNAIGSIAKIFELQIQASQAVDELFLERNSTLHAQSTINRTTTIETKRELRNVKIKQNYFSQANGVYYALAVLDRIETAKIYLQEIKKNNQEIERLNKEATLLPNKVLRYIALLKAKSLAEESKNLRDSYKVISVTGPNAPGIESQTTTSLLQNPENTISINFEYDHAPIQEIEIYLLQLAKKFGFRVQEKQGDLTLQYSLHLKPVNSNRNNIFCFYWRLVLSMKDNLGNSTFPVVVLEKRTLAISNEYARAKILREVRNFIFNDAFMQLMNSLTV